MEDVEEITLSIDDVYDLVDNLEKDLLKSEDVTWEQEKSLSPQKKLMIFLVRLKRLVK